MFLLHGGMENKDRRKALMQFEESGDYLICTDIAARGIDIPTLSWVLNYDLPFEPVYYIHRCGRVGRRGQPADVINFVTTKDFPLIERINTAIENQSSLKLARVVGKKTASTKAKQTRTSNRTHMVPKSQFIHCVFKLFLEFFPIRVLQAKKGTLSKLTFLYYIYDP